MESGVLLYGVAYRRKSAETCGGTKGEGGLGRVAMVGDAVGDGHTDWGGASMQERGGARGWGGTWEGTVVKKGVRRG